VYKLLAGKPEGKRPFGSPKRRWIDNIEMEILEIIQVVWGGLVWLSIWISVEPL
jgi:hypothetical protein